MNLEFSFTPEPFPWPQESEWEREADRSSPDYIRWVQSSLNRAEGLRLAVDGILGPATRSAIRNFQQRQGLSVDGIVGPQTEARLKALAGARSWGSAPVRASAPASAGVPLRASVATPSLPSPCGTPGPLPCAQRTTIDHFAEAKAVAEAGYQAAYDAAIRGLATCIGTALRGFLASGVIRIIGHTSAEGTVDFNRALAQSRAEQVTKDLEKALLAQGLTVATLYVTPIDGVVILKAETAGETTLRINPERTENDRKLNRRVEIDLSGLIRKPPGPAPAPANVHTLIAMVKQAIGSLPLSKAGIVLPTTARFLDPAEQTEAITVYGSSLDFKKILITDGIGAKATTGGPSRKFTLAVKLGSGWHVALMMGDVRCWASKPRSVGLIHELAHAWQSQHHPDPIAFMKNSLACQALADTATRVSGGRRVFSAYAYVHGLPFGQYAAEQIAQQVQHHYEGTGRPTPVVLTTIRAAARQAPVTANIDSLKVEDARERGAPGVY